MRIAALRGTVTTVSHIQHLSAQGVAKGLIDGGATCCLRTATQDELSLPMTVLQLAAGECRLHVNDAGVLLSPTPVSPIVSVAALLKMGYAMQWTNERCKVSHPRQGQLTVDTSSGCPEIEASVALDLIRDYEGLVTKDKARLARMNHLLNDLASLDTDSLVQRIREGGTESDAALRLVLSRRFPTIPGYLLDQLAVPLTDEQECHTWNRRTRRRLAKTRGILVHAFCGSSRKVFEKTALSAGLGHLPVDQKEDLLRASTYRYLLRQAVEGRVHAWVGGPPCRTYSICRYTPLGGKWGDHVP